MAYDCGRSARSRSGRGRGHLRKGAGGEVAVRRYVASQRRVSGEVFVPLSQPAGEAQFDFGEATVEIAGVRVKAALAVMTLPYSDAFLVSAYPRECTETFQAGHVAAFAFFGGVPTKMAYDNTRIAVSRIVGGNERTLDGQVSQRQGVRGAAPVALHGVRPGERRSLL